jgi:hypothetical protein
LTHIEILKEKKKNPKSEKLAHGVHLRNLVARKRQTLSLLKDM